MKNKDYSQEFVHLFGLYTHYVEFDTQKCTGNYQKSFRCHGCYENTLSLLAFNATLMGERKTLTRA